MLLVNKSYIDPNLIIIIKNAIKNMSLFIMKILDD